MGDSGLWKRLFIGNLPSNFNEDDIRSLFKGIYFLLLKCILIIYFICEDYNSIQRVDVKHTYAYVYFVDSKGKMSLFLGNSIMVIKCFLLIF